MADDHDLNVVGDAEPNPARERPWWPPRVVYVRPLILAFGAIHITAAQVIGYVAASFGNRLLADQANRGAILGLSIFLVGCIPYVPGWKAGGKVVSVLHSLIRAARGPFGGS